MIRTLSLALLVLASACGGKSKAAPVATTTAKAGGEGTGGGEHGEHAGLTPEMQRFHSVLRPNWHTEQGRTRMTSTCDEIALFQAEANAVATATPPVPADADTWTAGTRALVAAVSDLAAACKGTALAPFDAAFTRVHDAFHVLMTQAEAQGQGGGGADGGSKGSAAGSAAGSGAGNGHDHHGGHAH